MDITYLLWLQDFRNETHDILTPFLNGISLFVFTWLLFVPVFVYWCINKRKGIFLLLSLCLGWFMNGFMKITVCAYRPWIRDARIVPSSQAFEMSGGYSFPSGHTMWSSPIYAGVAVLCRKSAVWVSWLCVALILLTAFSRNYLGVHTPQDVIAGTAFGLFYVFAAAKLIKYIVEHPEREKFFLVAGLILATFLIVYATKKSYPMDYIDGKLIVDPVDMMKGTFHAAGMLVGFVIGRWLEKKFINFQSPGFTFKGVLLSLIGFAPYYVMIFGFTGRTDFFFAFMTGTFGPNWGHFVRGFVMTLYIVAIWPAVIKIFSRRN